MQANADTNQRLKQLIAKIETEQDPRTISVLVEELNCLLDSDKPLQPQPMTASESASGRFNKTLIG